MNELIEASLRFPTVVFTILLGIAMVYWLFVLIGALDIDLLGGADASGAAKGLGDALAGGAKGGAEGLKGLGDAIAGSKGGAEGAKLAVDGGGVWSGLGLGKVPVTISVSLILLVGWCGSLLAMHHLPDVFGHAAWLPATVLVGVVIVAMPITALLVRPLHPVFELKEGKSNRDYVGYTCTVTTGKVDHDFGQATVEDGGTVLNIPVRCDRTDVLARGDKALIIDFDPARQAYLVEPAADMLPPSEDGGSSEQPV